MSQEDLSQKEILEILKKSGKLNLKTQRFAKKIITVGCDLSRVGLEIDKFILDNEGVPAWPVNLSVNNEAAHNSYDIEQPIFLEENDVLKVDVGVSIDGYITDSAQTIIFHKKHEALKNASFQALLSVKNFLKQNYKQALVSDIGRIVEEEVAGSGFKVVENLTGHVIERFNPHAQPSIPNIKNHIHIPLHEIKLPFAVEPFVSDGNGFVTESNKILIFQHLEDKPIRNKDAKTILEEIKKYQGTPFSEYWVGKNLTTFQRRFALRELLKNEIIQSFPVLSDKKGSFVSQAETTFIIDDDEGLIDLVNIDEL